MGMKCPKCRSYHSTVLNTHYDAGRPRRYRVCGKRMKGGEIKDGCGHRWVTIEVIVEKVEIRVSQVRTVPIRE